MTPVRGGSQAPGKGVDVSRQEQRPATRGPAGARELPTIHGAPQRSDGDAQMLCRLPRREIARSWLHVTALPLLEYLYCMYCVLCALSVPRTIPHLAATLVHSGYASARLAHFWLARISSGTSWAACCAPRGWAAPARGSIGAQPHAYLKEGEVRCAASVCSSARSTTAPLI